MPTVAELNARVTADTSSFEAGMARSEGRLKSFQAKSKRYGRAMTRYVTLPILAGAGAAVKFAADAGETENKTRVTFGKMGDDVVNWSKKSIDTMGLASMTSQDMASQFGLLFQAAKMPGKEVVSLSKDFTQLAADMSSFFNIKADEALTTLRSGLVGETEPLRKFGILLSEAAVQEEALKSGLAATTEEISEQDKVTARATIIMESLTKAQGDFARTSDSVSNRARKSKERLKELAVTFGKELIPVAQEALKFLSGIMEKFQGMSPESRKLALKILFVAAALGPLVRLAGASVGAIGGIGKAFTLLARNPALVAVGLGIYAIHGALKATADKLAQFRENVDRAKGVLESGEAPLGRYRTAWERMGTQLDAIEEKYGRVLPILRIGHTAIGQIGRVAVAELNRKYDAWLERLAKLGPGMDKSTQSLVRNLIQQGNYTLAAKVLKEAEDKAMNAIRRRGRQLEKGWRETDRLRQSTKRYQALLDELKRKEERAAEAAKKHATNMNRLETGIRGVIAATKEHNRTPLRTVSGGGGMVAAQHGYEGWVRHPTLFLAGEGSSPEHVEITPQGKMGGRGGGGSGGGGGGRVPVKITNWKTGMGYIIERTLRQVDRDNDFAHRASRAHRRG